ncbi:radical SAM (seleno)protein TrsS [Mailhella massiliensis]|uniref:Radical SAM protein n=1 Tax=Mailhella massiliensis TaxID=1903261 RepID=A0A921AVK2_9BACT|nr:radical SAM (seleno)protein TrsS [Mailhella massiliensis]HJD96607.1 radical SAM protein [Mailhella massiliensis]
MLLSQTQSLCPVCLRLVDASYIKDGDTVYLRKRCPEHGAFQVPAWKEEEGAPEFLRWRQGSRIPAYPKSPATPLLLGCPYDCGLCPDHAQHTCTGLIEVTMRCSLGCPVCYARAGGGDGDPSLEHIQTQLDTLLRASGPCNVQLSGGEPTERDDLPEIIRTAKARGFALVQVNTNGLRLGREKGYAAALRAAGLDSVYLQFDGVDDTVFRTLRGRPCLEEKTAALEACRKAGLGVVLVCTLARGVNDHQAGELLRFALAQGNHVRGLHFQPVSSFGRFPWDMAEAPRITLPELMLALEKQSGGLVRTSHFHAPSCEHPLCSFSAVYARAGDALEGPLGAACCSGGTDLVRGSRVLDNAETSRVSRAFTAAHWSSPQEENTSLNDAFSRFLASSGAERRFTLSAMAFQDALSVDIERVRGCCIHVVSHDGRLIPFCLHNLTSLDNVPLYRGTDRNKSDPS